MNKNRKREHDRVRRDNLAFNIVLFVTIVIFVLLWLTFTEALKVVAL